jgi:hypothetical protein
LNGGREPANYDGIITNPPYDIAQEFIERALEYTRPRRGVVAMLCRVDFDSAKTRQHLFGGCPVFSKKLVLTKRIVWFGRPGAAPSFNHSWMIWTGGIRGQQRSRMRRLHLPPPSPRRSALAVLRLVGERRKSRDLPWLAKRRESTHSHVEIHHVERDSVSGRNRVRGRGFGDPQKRHCSARRAGDRV